jgi:hypothetical protein
MKVDRRQYEVIHYLLSYLVAWDQISSYRTSVLLVYVLIASLPLTFSTILIIVSSSEKSCVKYGLLKYRLLFIKLQSI